MKTKWITAIFLLALALTCKAGSDCENCDTKTRKPSQKIATKAASRQLTRTSQIGSSNPAKSGFCRDMYCKHAAGSPWWPGAPGD